MTSITANDIMVKRLITLNPDMDVHDAVKLLLKNRISGAPVVDASGAYLGVFSERCCLGAILDAAYEQLPTHRVGAFMDTEAKTISADTQLLSIAQVFLLTSARRLPVVDESNRLLGQISRRDVIQAGMKQINQGPARESSVLYLSALGDRQHAPIS
ncbi:Inosine-5'-monophosphate dehydrogenase [Posidoniimonas corsicana]|uniref:Inosine-5'-monophosphate dehydrogenase n=1 Tax=Posidoniimonas corsicana TaxID=1938618 RepID=A0A5C5VG56_9BACT|nr:CBS domain-containing protein [Posidoniimonas corsicana]TWT37658.1 Inosine-5'-monophosphate dehydrogenase [Posidoniimonas corsicana]